MSEDKKKQDSLYSKNIFDDEMSLINSEIETLDDLYSELKGHFDSIKNSQARGSLTFIKDQTSNLIAIKNAKLSYIKQRADMKRNVTDFAFKERNLNRESSEGMDNFTAELYKKIANEFKYVQDDNKQNSESNIDNNEEDIDKLLDEQLDDIDIGTIVESSTSIEEVDVDYNVTENEEETVTDSEEIVETNLDEEKEDEPDNTITVVDMDTIMFYKIDKDTFDVVEELGHVEDIVDTTDIEDETYAIGESGVIYLTVVFEDE